MQPDTDVLIANLAKTQSGFLRAADSVTALQWKMEPSEGRWSAAELVAHLMMVERAVIGKADRLSQKTPKRVSFLKRIHAPIVLGEVRLIRLKSPIPVDPQLLRDKEAMLAELREVRERSVAFLEETRGRDLSAYCWPHPALGTLNTYGWMRLIAAHEIRHTKQMREIAASLPKVIESLQK
ncbi:MAG: DinB family protein [Candidatus Acidiferrum sp.]